jgi:hypothetical protein
MSKYHATHLGMLNERQLTAIDGIFYKVMRQAIGLLPNLPMEGVQWPMKKTGLDLSPMRDRATQMGIEHLTRIMNKDTERASLHISTSTDSYPNSVIGHSKHWNKTS